MERSTNKVGSVTLTQRYVVCEVCRLRQDDYAILHPEEMRRRSELFHMPTGSRAELETAVSKGIAWLKEAEPELAALTVSSCRPVKSVHLADRSTGSGYGVICPTSENPEWTGVDLYQHAVSSTRSFVSPINIFVHVDVALGSIGDFHCRTARWLNNLKRAKEISHFGTLAPNAIANTIAKYRLLYVKLSDTIEAFVSVGGRLLPTVNVPNYGSITPRKLSIEGIDDPFPGVCEVHGACNTGLFGSHAIEARLNMRGKTDFHAQQASCPEERILTGYTAELIRMINYVHQVDSVTLGGRLVDDQKIRNAPSERVIDIDVPRQTWARLVDLLEGDYRHRFLPRAERIFRQPVDEIPDCQISGDYVSSACCAFPVAFGGLVHSAQMYQSPTESRVVQIGPKGQ